MLELFIEGKKIDLTDDIEISFNYETIDPDKLSSIKNSFSKTINIQGTPQNNITFGHIFRNDKYIGKSDSTPIENNYDPHKRVNWLINKNGSVVNYGYCTLDAIIKKENEITYQLTLYGGIGEFFYNLNYTQDGEIKNLSNIFFDWRPKTTLVGYGNAMNEGEENTNVLMKCTPEIIAQSYHNLNPNNSYTGTTDIDKDIVFVPVYNGYYENFDSKHMLVNTKNNTLYVPPYIEATKRIKLKNAFPDTLNDYSEDPNSPTNYTTLNVNMGTTGNTYGLATFSRDLDPSEAGELRVNEMPVAIRVSKLMAAISNPINNGNYTVDWDEDITDSNYWKYGYIILDKIKQDKNNVPLINVSKNTSYDDQPFDFIYNMSTNTTSGISASTFTPYNYVLDITNLNSGNYNLNYHITPSFKIQMGYTSTLLERYISGGYKNYINNRGIYIWNSLVRVSKIYDSSTLKKIQLDIFYFKQNGLTSVFDFGNPTKNPFNYNQVSENTKTTLANKIANYLQTTINPNDVYIHNCNFEIGTETHRYAPWPTVNDQSEYYDEIKCTCNSEKVIVNFDLSNNTTALSVNVQDLLCWSLWEYTINNQNYDAGIWGNDYPTSLLVTLPTNQISFFSNVNGKENPWINPIGETNSTGFSIKENFNESTNNAIISTKSVGYSIIYLDKKTLFANSSTPFKYLADFCKLLNLRFICDNTNKKIYIKKLKNYYKDEIVDINNKVDLGREINIKNVLTNNKIINLGLQTTETYPITIFNKNSKEKFNFKKYDTGIEFNYTTNNLMDNFIYENSAEWQMSSVFYNNNSQFPKAYNVPSINWTLFNVDPNTDELKKKDFYTVGVPSTTPNLMANDDFLPKIAMFDKDNKILEIKNTFVFLNGFIKNYDYNEIDSEPTDVVQTPDQTITGKYIKYSNGEMAGASYRSIWIFNDIDPTATYKFSAKFPTGWSNRVINYFTSSDVFISSAYPQSSGAEYTNQVISNIPSNCGKIKMNICTMTDYSSYFQFVKVSDQTKNVISPRIMLTNDTYEQFYFNGDRCYLYSFNYDFNFENWGCWDFEEKTSAAPWNIPFFSRDLYNLYNSTSNIWEPQDKKIASWNIVEQENIDSFYTFSENNTKFIKSPLYNYTLSTTTISNVNNNEYFIYEIPTDDENTRIYNDCWEKYLNEMYDRNTREITIYADLSTMGSNITEILRKIYNYDGQLWIIRKIENYKISDVVNDRFSKITLHKIINKNNWVN